MGNQTAAHWNNTQNLQVGGKNFEQSMENVDEFVGQLRARLSELGFRRTVAFLDENFTASEKYESKLSSGFVLFLIDFGLFQVYCFGQPLLFA